MTTAADIFSRDGALIGMVHVAALPGTPRHELSMDEITGRAVDDARKLVDAGFDALMIENMHDAPYLRKQVGPEIVAAMTAVGVAVQDVASVPLGIQVLAGGNREALAIAKAVGAGYIRAEGFVFASVADEGVLDEADAGPLLRYRRAIGADDIFILADIKKKHSSHALTADVDIASTAEAAAFFGADGVVVTGEVTGRAVETDDLGAVRGAVKIPVVVGSGVTPDNAEAMLAGADALIIGSWCKDNGVWSNEVDLRRAREIVAAVR
ncbi:MAG: BtpA/SgcQ family protein [Planctomycetota bacterium]|jgi:membrane complex biogenesis BtpA family protein